MREISSTHNWIMIIIGMALSGLLYNIVVYPDEPVFIGVVFAVMMCTPLVAFERGLLLRPLSRRIEQLPTPGFVISTLVTYEILMSTGYAIAAIPFWSLGMLQPRPLTAAIVMPLNVFLYAMAVTALIIFILRVRDLLGRDVFTSMLISRYRNPVKEERIFLFIDLADSTPFAEKHGDLRAQQFLKALFAAFAEPVRRHKGAIDDYVGDAAIITWPLQRGIKHARCVRCVFDILQDIETNAALWHRKFGQVPRLRAALHGGFIITAEIGVDHHKISYFGDTVNTTARLESLCKSLNRPVLISAELAQRMKMPDTVAIEDLGNHAVKGRGQALAVMALAQRAPGEIAAPIEALRIPAQ